MQDVYLGLGSNLGDREAMLREALSAVGDLNCTEICAVSPSYETSPMGPQDQGPYLNCAAHIRTDRPPLDLVEALQQIESSLGRAQPQQRHHWGPREIDIDILLYGVQVIDEPVLQIPHPGMHERWFVLKPLADIAPDVIHPRLHHSVSNLLEQLQPSESAK